MRVGPVRPAPFLRHVLLLALSAVLAASASAQQSPTAPAPTAPSSPAAPAKVEPTLEPKALEVLKASSSRLAAARTMSFTAVVSYESPSRPGPPLVYTTRSEVTLERPNKLRVITPGDGPASEFYYDGRTVMAFAPAENLVAIADAPRTIDATLEAAYRYAATYFPFTDVMVADPYKDIADAAELAFYIGRSRTVGGTTTDMVAYAVHGVFIQVWIGTADKLPRRARAVYRDDPLRLRHQVDFSDWKLGVATPVGAFTSVRAAKAKRIPFAHPNVAPLAAGAPPAQAAPPAAGTPSKDK